MNAFLYYLLMVDDDGVASWAHKFCLAVFMCIYLTRAMLCGVVAPFFPIGR